MRLKLVIRASLHKDRCVQQLLKPKPPLPGRPLISLRIPRRTARMVAGCVLQSLSRRCPRTLLPAPTHVNKDDILLLSSLE